MQSEFPELVDRFWIARLLNVSRWQVRANEVEWGLCEARVDLNPRVIRYVKAVVLRKLAARLPKSAQH